MLLLLLMKALILAGQSISESASIETVNDDEHPEPKTDGFPNAKQFGDSSVTVIENTTGAWNRAELKMLVLAVVSTTCFDV